MVEQVVVVPAHLHLGLAAIRAAPLLLAASAWEWLMKAWSRITTPTEPRREILLVNSRVPDLT